MLIAHLYPWDVIDAPKAVDALIHHGVERVVLAAAYHSVRAATPRHPQHRVVTAPSFGLYTARSNSSAALPYADGWAGPDSFGRAKSLLENAGLPVTAWIVLAHDADFGRAHPEATVINAYGDHYSYALCPSHPAVQERAALITRAVFTKAETDAVFFEAPGQLGFEHAGSHEKTQGADWSPAERSLLSLCFCEACRRRLGEVAEEAHHLIIDALQHPEDFHERFDALGNEVFDTRALAASGLIEIATDAAKDAGVHDVSVLADPDPRVFGATLSPHGPVRGVSNFILPAALDENDISRLHALASLTEGDVSIFVNFLDQPVEGLGAVLTRQFEGYCSAGVRDIHAYHFGLASTRRGDIFASAYRSASMTSTAVSRASVIQQLGAT